MADKRFVEDEQGTVQALRQKLDQEAGVDMPCRVQRISQLKPVEYARFPPRTYSTIQQGLMQVLVERKVGRNGLLVMIALCAAVYADGRLGRTSSDLMSEITGLTANQNARGMKELRDKRIITPVIRRTKEDYRHPDRSNFGHVAQYCFTKEVWARIETISNEDDHYKGKRY